MAKTVVVIDDDLSLTTALIEKLQAEGFVVKTADDGVAGFSLVDTLIPDIVILDIMLCGAVNGFDVLEKMKAETRLAQIPVVMVTNLDSEEKVAKQIGAHAYLVKANTSLAQIVAKVTELA